MNGYYPDGLSRLALCHIEGHDYGREDKPVSTCQRCGEQNFALRGHIGAITRKARAWGVTWQEADNRTRKDAA